MSERARELPDRIVTDLDELYLTEYSVYKTESFSLATQKLVNVNVLLTHLAFAALKAGLTEGRFCFFTQDVKLFADLIPAGKAGAAVVFYDFHSYPVTGGGDARLRGLTEWRVERAPETPYSDAKLYRTFSDGVNLPLLNEQFQITLRVESVKPARWIAQTIYNIGLKAIGVINNRLHPIPLFQTLCI